MMYPGDLNGGAENVANCKCWLSYSNRKPSDLRGTGKKTTNKSTKSKNNNSFTSKIKNTVKKPINNIKSKLSRKSQPETKTTINNMYKRIMNTIKSKIKEKEVKKIMKNYHDYSSIENLFEYLRQIYPEPYLSKEEIENVAQWARDSNFFNEYFFNRKISSDDFEKVKVLNNIINKYPNIKSKVQLHRFQRDDFFIVDVGKKGIFRKFISTSFSVSKSKEYGDYHIIFLTPEGTNGAFIEETLRKYDGREDKHSMEDVLVYNTYYETLYMNYRTNIAVIRIIVE